MQTEACLPRDMRDALRTALPERAFLRRDRGDALFISNAPTFGSGTIEIPGFILEESAGMLHILPDESWIVRCEQTCAPDFLSRSLARFRGEAPDRDNLVLFARGVKLLDAAGSASATEINAFDRCLRQRAALALRGGCGGGLYAAALVNAQLQQMKGEPAS